MSENLTNTAELAQDVQTFVHEIRQKSGELTPGEKVSFVESAYIGRKPYGHRYICDVIADENPDQPYNVNLWDYVSPIYYSKEEYTFETEKGIYMRSGVSAEPGMETALPDLYDWGVRPATAIELGRVVGILEYLERESSDQLPASEGKPKPGSNLAKWILGRK